MPRAESTTALGADGGPAGSSHLHNLAVGQVAEWMVWTRLVTTSGGDLHVFLPLDDRGVDGIVHRISTDTYARLQASADGTLHTQLGTVSD